MPNKVVVIVPNWQDAVELLKKGTCSLAVWGTRSKCSILSLDPDHLDYLEEMGLEHTGTFCFNSDRTCQGFDYELVSPLEMAEYLRAFPGMVVLDQLIL